MSYPPPPPPPPPQGDQPRPGYGNPMPNGYTAYAPGTGLATATHSNGTTILVLGILSLVACGLLGPVAWSMGNAAIKEMDARPDLNYTNRGNVTAGRVCGMIATGLLALGLIVVLLVVIAAAANA